MASGDLRKELECSICLGVYTDPVNLKCGHNFCRVCIDRVLDTQEGAGGYSCPECREEFEERPALQRNITLRNIMEKLRSTQHNREEIGILCTYCVDSPVAAVKSCLLCEASLCEKHLRVHSKSPEHVITDPSTSPGNRKCPEHKKILEYYCTEDSTCVCVSCRLDGDHQGHMTQILDKAAEYKKGELRNILLKLTIEREDIEGKVQNLQKHRRRVHKKAVRETKRFSAGFRDLRRQLEDLEKRVLGEISRQEERASLSLSAIIQRLEIQKEELSRKMRHIEELCNLTDPLTVLQEPDTGDTEERDSVESEGSEGRDLDVAGLSCLLHMGLCNMIAEVNRGLCLELADILLDVDTASNNVRILKDRKTALWSSNLNRGMTPARFQEYPQVLSSHSFSSGCHYWDVDVGRSQSWRVGITYPNAEKRGVPVSLIGNNTKSWSLFAHSGQYGVTHDSKVTLLPALVSGVRVRIGLDYEAGRVSFYDLCDPIRHLHTFTTTFTEPLHAALGVWGGCIKVAGGANRMSQP